MRHTQKRGTIVSPVPITLRIVSPHLPGLSMVDMPGLTKVPIDGQPKSIVQVGAAASCQGRSMLEGALTARVINSCNIAVCSVRLGLCSCRLAPSLPGACRHLCHLACIPLRRHAGAGEHGA